MTGAVADFLEASYRGGQSDEQWGEALCNQFGSATSLPALAVSSMVYELTDSLVIQPTWEVRNDPAHDIAKRTGCDPIEIVEQTNASPIRVALASPTYASPYPTLAVVSDLPAAVRQAFVDTIPPGCDMLGLFGPTTLPGNMEIGCLLPDATRVTPAHRNHLVRLAEHLRVAYGLRAGEFSHQDGHAVLGADGRIKDISQEAASTPRLAERLRKAAQGMDRARCRQKRCSDEEALLMWQALIDGEYAIVETFERNGSRQLVAVRVPSRGRPLGKIEAAVIREVALGHSNKRVGAKLGIAEGTVAAHLSRALRKLGCPDRTALIRWFGSHS